MISFLALGSNLGNKEENLERAIALINSRAGEVVRRSTFLVTEPWGFNSENNFLNACIAIDTHLPPRQLLSVTKQIEFDMGRTAKSTEGEYHDRVIDIDILLYGDVEIDEPDLKIPHPLMHERDFVMIPLEEIL